MTLIALRIFLYILLLLFIQTASSPATDLLFDDTDEYFESIFEAYLLKEKVSYYSIWRHDPSDPSNPLKKKLLKYVYFNKQGQIIQITQNDIAGNNIKIDTRKYTQDGLLFKNEIRTQTDTLTKHIIRKKNKIGLIDTLIEKTYRKDSVISHLITLKKYDKSKRLTEDRTLDQNDSLIKIVNYRYNKGKLIEKKIHEGGIERCFVFEYDKNGKKSKESLKIDGQCIKSTTFEYNENGYLSRKCENMSCRFPCKCIKFNFNQESEISSIGNFNSEKPFNKLYTYNSKGLPLLIRFYMFDQTAEEQKYYDEIYSLTYQYRK